MRKFVLIAVTAISLAGLSTPASAETRSIVVSYADLNLDSPTGVAALESRMQVAAKKICGRTDRRLIYDGVDQRRCMRSAQESIRVEIARLTNTRPSLAIAEGR